MINYKKFFIIFIMFFVLLSGCSHSHNYSELSINPTCTEKGYTTYTCECGETYSDNFIDPLGHNFSEWKTVKESTNTLDGLKERICDSCSYKEEEIIPRLIHVHNYSQNIIKPTCTNAGYTNNICECGDNYIDSYVEKIPHEYFTEIIDPTCTSKGYTIYTCKNCDYKYISDYLDMLDHNYYKEIIDPTCTSKGYTVYSCINCDYIYQDNYTNKISHTFGEWYIINEPTVFKDGERERVCNSCGLVETEIISKIEVPQFVNITYDLNGGLFTNGYTSIDELSKDFIKDYNLYSDTQATINNFLKDSTSSVKIALSNIEMLKKWNWLFKYMYAHLEQYNKDNNSLEISYVSDSLDLLPKLIDLDTSVINDTSKGPNFRTLLRSYLHGMMNHSKGDPVGNPTFSLYVPDFSDDLLDYNLLLSQYNLNVLFYKGDKLPTPVRELYDFVGWQDSEGNIITIPLKDTTLKAIWKEGTPVDEIKITNKIYELNLYDTYQLTWEISPSDAVCKEVKFYSSDESILRIDSNGLISTLKAGTVIVKIISLGLTNKVDEFSVNVVAPGYFDISYETDSYVSVDSSIRLNAIYINSLGNKEEVKWESLNTEIAAVDDNGLVDGLKPGNVYIRSKISEKVYQDFLVTVVSEDVSIALRTVLDAHVSNVFVEYNLGIGAGTPVYYMDIIGSISKLLFNEELEINNTYNKTTNEKYGEELKNRLLESVEFITVHYTGSMASGDTAEAIAKYFAKPLTSVKTSIHYSTGNDGIFRGMDEIYRAAHAGDDGSLDTVDKFEWLDTPVEVMPNDPKFPIVTITKNSTFAINGKDTFIKVPNETKFGRGMVTDSKWLNKMGLAVNIKDGKYQLGTSWWCYTQVWEGRICSNGGNRNSIGIESCVNKGSDLWYTWQKTAMLCADIMYRYNLDITRVKGHHFYSAKNCPQPMLENELEIWWEFIELVEAEYTKLTKCSDYKFNFTTNSDYLNNNGRVVKQGLTSQLLEYTVTIIDNNKTETITLGSILEGTYNK